MTPLAAFVIPPIAVPAWPVLAAFGLVFALGAVYFGAGLLRGKK